MGLSFHDGDPKGVFYLGTPRTWCRSGGDVVKFNVYQLLKMPLLLQSHTTGG